MIGWIMVIAGPAMIAQAIVGQRGGYVRIGPAKTLCRAQRPLLFTVMLLAQWVAGIAITLFGFVLI